MGEELKAYLDRLLPYEEASWLAMQSILKPKRLARHEHFLVQGQVCRQLGFIAKGYVRLYYLVGDAEITKDFNFEDEFCGSYASFISESPALFNVIAMEPVHLYTIPRDKLMVLYENHCCWQKLGRISMEKMFVRKEQREASFLLDSPEERYQKLLKEAPHWVQRIPLKYLASYLGMAPETLSRIRKKR
ncbi:Crp/Fnr family transcriptional regulator [Catalinimonas niigatensis]|uniref:Crp/Fnr family transcriptional regulator n=1 Tax=Catalinimonas niigatensis TaxID=1397264 RepID=UPI0026657A77|nr:Crp/Fnr family transcriptional regulator [Catalinimonas niigatensis]WPP49341.1 Crp/Fnr family transcriptional regulator [Catalinimonas niigatensis]